MSLLSGVRNGHALRKDRKRDCSLRLRREYVGFVVAQKATKNCVTKNKDLQLPLQAYSGRGYLYTYPFIIIRLTLSSSFSKATLFQLPQLKHSFRVQKFLSVFGILVVGKLL